MTIITEPGKLVPVDGDTALIRLAANSGHGHADGDTCVACAAQTDVRALLYNLLGAAGMVYLFAALYLVAALMSHSLRGTQPRAEAAPLSEAAQRA